MSANNTSYNERLFERGGLRGWFHIGRFRWLKKTIEKEMVNQDVVIELGCFDGRSLSYLPELPKEYYGFDANWEGGLEMAKEKYSNNSSYNFYEVANSDQMTLPAGTKASLAISMETLEHIPDEVLIGYVNKLAGLISGVFLVTVPNEKGLLFLVKYLLKLIVHRDSTQGYTAFEVLCATFGRMKHVKRNQHKGFDYLVLREILERKFELVRVEGVQFPLLPLWCNPQIGFVFRKSNTRSD